jgi:hypothetical protein
VLPRVRRNETVITHVADIITISILLLRIDNQRTVVISIAPTVAVSIYLASISF